MQRHWAHRLAAACFAVWFGIVGLDAGVLVACPMHGVSAVPFAHSVAANPHAEHGDHAVGDAQQHESQSQSHSGHHCNCPGAGCCSTMASMPAATVAAIDAHVAEPMLLSLRREQPRIRVAAHSLPFANGPPKLA